MKSFIYSESTIAFVTAAAQTCLLIEKAGEHEREEWREQMLRLLPVLYLRTRLLEQAECVMEEEPQRFVAEEDYNYAQTAYISEGLADIYQELKDMAAAFQTGEEPIMNDAVVLCREAFEAHWGQKLLAVMRALHAMTIDN